MLRLTEKDCKDIHFVTMNGLVRVAHVCGSFSKSTIKEGDFCLSINGTMPSDASQAARLIFKQSTRLIIMLSFSLSRLKANIVEYLLPQSQVVWEAGSNVCRITFSIGKKRYERRLRVHNDGNCEDISDNEVFSRELDKQLKKFTNAFYDEFHLGISDLAGMMKRS